MTETKPEDKVEERRLPEPHKRIFLVVADESEEMHLALRYAARRAWMTGGNVALLYVMSPADFQEWSGVESVMKEEMRREAEKLMLQAAKTVNDITGQRPGFYLRQGNPQDELLKLQEEDRSITVLVLATRKDSDDPGPLLKYLTSKGLGKLRIPVVMVPGNLSEADVDELSS